jgi:hypothetical protein
MKTKMMPPIIRVTCPENWRNKLLRSFVNIYQTTRRHATDESNLQYGSFSVLMFWWLTYHWLNNTGVFCLVNIFTLRYNSFIRSLNAEWQMSSIRAIWVSWVHALTLAEWRLLILHTILPTYVQQLHYSLVNLVTRGGVVGSGTMLHVAGSIPD